MDDPLDVRTAGGLRVHCQIMSVACRDDATLIDLVTLERCRRATDERPAGTPLTLGFRGTPPGEGRQDLERLMRHWEARHAVLLLEAADVAVGIGYQFCDGKDQLLIVLDDLPPQPPVP